MAADKATNVGSLPVPGTFLQKCIYFIWYEMLSMIWIPPLALWHDIFHSIKKFDYNALPKCTGKVAVLTGGTRGIGSEVLKKLLQMDYHIVAGVRNTDACEKVIDGIRLAGVKTGNAKCLLLDLKSLKSVQKFSENVLKEVDRIDLLINNAAVMLEPYDLTGDGYETHFQVNYLSHFFLCQLLLPKMKATALGKNKNCRVVNVSSLSHLCSFADHVENMHNPKVYSPAGAYMDSKLCQIMFTKYQDAKLKSENANVDMFAVHPGTIVTDLWVNMPLPLSIKNWLKNLFRSLDTGAEVVMYAAISPELEGKGGQYIINHRIHEASKATDNLYAQRQLWDLSQKCVHETIFADICN